ncbi:MAG: lysophospholipid acyltransferase family protein [Pyrinomonadaceae bacterium]
MFRTVIGGLSRTLWKIQFVGTENIRESGGLIVASNHQTYIDPFWISLPIKRPTRYLAWSAAFKWPFVGKCLTRLGAWPLQIEGSDPAAIRRSLQWLRGGGVIVIFPEGARATADGTLDRFKAGAVRLALEAEVPILPVTIRGGSHVWPRGWRLPHSGRVVITYHPLFLPEQRMDEDARVCARRETQRLAQIIGSALASNVE